MQVHVNSDRRGIEEDGAVKVPISECRVLARRSLRQIFERGLFGVNDAAPSGTLRGVDVLKQDVLVQKLSRATIIFAGARDALPDFLRPTTFYEKLVLAKFFAPIPMPSPADKLGLEPYCTSNAVRFAGPFPPIWAGREPITPALLERLALPDGCYFAKSNCGSGTNFPFALPTESDRLEKLEAASAGWLKSDHGLRAGEWWYGLIGARNFIERDMSDGRTSLTDWKFHVGGGRVCAVQVDRDRSTNHQQLIYARDFTYLPEMLFFQTGEPDEKPAYFDDMVRIAEDIAKPFEYARIDLYDIDGTIYLGEITLAPMGGLRMPRSAALDAYMGEHWQSPFFGT